MCTVLNLGLCIQQNVNCIEIHGKSQRQNLFCIIIAQHCMRYDMFPLLLLVFLCMKAWIKQVFQIRIHSQDKQTKSLFTQNVFLSNTLQNAPHNVTFMSFMIHSYRIKMYPFCLYPITINYILLTWLVCSFKMKFLWFWGLSNMKYLYFQSKMFTS